MSEVRSGPLEIPPVSFLVPDSGSMFLDWSAHIPFLGFLLYHLSPKRYVELGVLDGNSYFSACEMVRLLGIDCACYGIDPWEGTFQRGGDMLVPYSGEYYTRVRDRNATRYSRFSQLMRMKGEAALPQFPDGSVDLLHIDANHSYEGVKGDFESWFPKVSEQGVVLFHDVLNFDEGTEVPRFWGELKQGHRCYENHFSYGLGVLFKGDKYPAQLRQLYTAPKEVVEQIDSIFECLGNLTKVAHQAVTRGLA